MTLRVRLPLMIMCLFFFIKFSLAQEFPDTTKAVKLVLYRPAQQLGCALKITVLINNDRFKLKNKETQTIELTAGSYLIETKGSELHVEFKSGKTYYFRLNYDFNFLFGKPVIIQVTENQAKKELATLPSWQKN